MDAVPRYPAVDVVDEKTDVAPHTLMVAVTSAAAVDKCDPSQGS